MTGILSYKANSIGDVVELSKRFKRLSAYNQRIVLAHVYDLGLMTLPLSSPGNIAMAAAINTVKLVKGQQGLYTYFSVLPNDVIEQMINGVAEHITSGKDREDVDSAGGWSQRELDLLLTCVRFVRKENTEAF